MVRYLVDFPRRSALALINFYRLGISPLFGPSCRFEPTCSSYAVEAIEQWGFLRGGAMTVVRLVKCGPWHPGGVDFVPQNHTHDSTHDSISDSNTKTDQVPLRGRDEER